MKKITIGAAIEQYDAGFWTHWELFSLIANALARLPANEVYPTVSSLAERHDIQSDFCKWVFTLPDDENHLVSFHRDPPSWPKGYIATLKRAAAMTQNKVVE